MQLLGLHKQQLQKRRVSRFAFPSPVLEAAGDPAGQVSFFSHSPRLGLAPSALLIKQVPKGKSPPFVETGLTRLNMRKVGLVAGTGAGGYERRTSVQRKPRKSLSQPPESGSREGALPPETPSTRMRGP